MINKREHTIEDIERKINGLGWSIHDLHHSDETVTLRMSRMINGWECGMEFRFEPDDGPDSIKRQIDEYIRELEGHLSVLRETIDGQIKSIVYERKRSDVRHEQGWIEAYNYCMKGKDDGKE